MKAYVVDVPDGQFHAVDVPMLQPPSGHVLVKVAASGINPLDTKIRAGQGGHAKQPLPAVLGLDMAGTVVTAADDVTAFQAGDEVYGMVFSTVSEDKISVVENFRAVAIDRYAAVQDYVDKHTGGEGFDIVYDTLGGAVLDASFQALKRYTGHVVSCLGWGSHSLARLSFRAGTYSGVFTLLPLLTGLGRVHHGEILRAAAELADQGRLKPLMAEATFSTNEIAAAFDTVAKGSRGKVVVEF